MPSASRFAGVILLLTLAAAVGDAQPKKNKEEAGSHFIKGIEFYKEGNYAAALAEFNAAYQAVPSYEVLFNIGLSQRRLFKYGDAVKTLNQYLAEGAAKVPRDRREAVKKELDAVRSMVAEVTIKVDGAPAVVELDGEKLGHSPFAQPLLIGPGKHTFRAEREGEEPDEKTIELTSGTRLELALKPKVIEKLPGELTVASLPPGAVITIDGKVAGAAPVKTQLKEGGHELIAELDRYVTARTEVVITAGQARKVTIELEPTGRGPRKLNFPVLGVVIVGVGGLTLGGGAALSLSAQGASKSISALFKSGGQWNDSYAAIESSGKSAQLWSTVLIVSGALIATTGVVVGLITLLAGGSEAAEEAPAEESGLYLLPGTGGATVGWSTRW